jgi:DNA-binding CsgD family transcriptional regulator
MPVEVVLCRGWTRGKIREAVMLASPAQRDVLQQIALNAPITATEVAELLGRSLESVRAGMSAWSRLTKTLGVVDPSTGRPSWPWTYRKRRDGTIDYILNQEVREAILSVTGQA